MSLTDKYKSMKLGTKVVMIVFAMIALIFAFVLFYQNHILQRTHIAKEISRSRALTAFCEGVRNFAGNLRDLEIYDNEKMIGEIRETLGEKDYSKMKMYRTIPVVSAWTAAREKAAELGYEFRVPKNRPRNPKNAPRPGVEKAVVDYLEGKGTIGAIEKAGAKVIFPEEKNTAAEIGEIGIVHTGVETDGLEDGKTGNIDAVRFFRSIKLTNDCMVCHGEPAGSLDILGFEKEGWKAGEVHGAFEIISPLDKMRKEVSEARRDNIFLAVALFFLSACVFYFYIRSVVGKPIEKIVEYTKRIGEGDFSSMLNLKGRDEIGFMAAHIDSSVGNLREIIKVLSDTSATLSGSSFELAGTSAQMAASAGKMNEKSDSVAGATEEVSVSVGNVASTARESSSGVMNIAAMTEEMSVNVMNVADLTKRTSEKVKNMAEAGELMSGGADNLAAAIEEMTMSLGEVERNTDQAGIISKEANHSVELINQKMNALAGASKQIGKFVDSIKDIADQTNMLALNATIEAAGAGESGKGFSVVASEVKELAKQSAEASDEISLQVENIRDAIKDVSNAMGAMNKVVMENRDINQTIAAAVKEQRSTAGEISKTVADNARTARDVSESASEASGLVREIVAATDETSQSSDEAAKNVNEVSNSVKDIAMSINEAALGVNEIAKNIQEINEEAGGIADAASKTNAAAGDLAENSARLSAIVGKFQVGE